MGRLSPGHISIHPEDQEGREVVTTVRTDSAGEELTVEFRATICMEMSAFEALAKNKFKGVYWLSPKPLESEN